MTDSHRESVRADSQSESAMSYEIAVFEDAHSDEPNDTKGPFETVESLIPTAIGEAKTLSMGARPLVQASVCEADGEVCEFFPQGGYGTVVIREVSQ